ncbi:hypothetical protein DL93DRAFT_2092506 [Clavulina sp. PMI_390]|nr:hypothetical protein DL93DRAFT_2092506 [Clavulina sp. PMI_390]
MAVSDFAIPFYAGVGTLAFCLLCGAIWGIAIALESRQEDSRHTDIEALIHHHGSGRGPAPQSKPRWKPGRSFRRLRGKRKTPLVTQKQQPEVSEPSKTSPSVAVDSSSRPRWLSPVEAFCGAPFHIPIGHLVLIYWHNLLGGENDPLSVRDSPHQGSLAALPERGHFAIALMTKRQAARSFIRKASNMEWHAVIDTYRESRRVRRPLGDNDLGVVALRLIIISLMASFLAVLAHIIFL